MLESLLAAEEDGSMARLTVHTECLLRYAREAIGGYFPRANAAGLRIEERDRQGGEASRLAIVVHLDMLEM